MFDLAVLPLLVLMHFLDSKVKTQPIMLHFIQAKLYPVKALKELVFAVKTTGSGLDLQL